jgi:hypothetical protein
LEPLINREARGKRKESLMHILGARALRGEDLATVEDRLTRTNATDLL